MLTCPDAAPAAFFAHRLPQLQEDGVVGTIVLDPGFGFGKTLEENYVVFSSLDQYSRLGHPLLVGVSRKSMICRPLGIAPDEALAPTVALGAMALMKGARILRVHDVREARQTVALYSLMRDRSPQENENR